MTEEDVCVIVPTLNEETTIGDVVSGLQSEGFDNILVIDGGSEDDTVDVAEDAGATVRTQSGSGKGQAVREAISEHAQADTFLMLDGDGTYDPADAEKLLDPILSGDADHVIGNRFADMEAGAMTRLNRAGNRIINRLFTVLYGRPYTDILSGYRAFTRQAWEEMTMNVESDGFGIETELAVESVRQNIATNTVDIKYRARPEGSESSLSPFRDGATIFRTMYRFTRLSHPVLYFSAAAFLCIVSSIGIAGYVLVEWVTTRTPHEVLAVLAGFLFLFGVQLVVFGVLGDLVVKLHREQRRRLDRIEDKLD